MTPTELFIRLPLKTFVNIYLNNHDNDYIDFPVGELLHVIDENESICHIEFFSPNKIYFEIPFECNPTRENPAVLWKISAWRKSVVLYEERRKKAEQELTQDLKRREEIAKVLKAIIDKTGLPKEIAENIAVKIVCFNRVAARQWNVEL